MNVASQNTTPSIATQAESLAAPQRCTDTRVGQANRVADYLTRHPGSTAKEIDSACDTGCITKVLSEMGTGLGYGLRKDWREVPCSHGGLRRRVRVYHLVYRPTQQPDLFASA